MQLRYFIVIGLIALLQLTELKAEDEELTNLLQSVDHAKDTSESYVIYNKIFSSIDEITLNQLVHHENKSISIRAAWERLENRMKKQSKKGRIKNKNFMIGQFCGVVETQTQCNIPQWWSDAIVKIRMREGYYEFPKISFENKLNNRVAIVDADMLDFVERAALQTSLDGTFHDGLSGRAVDGKQQRRHVDTARRMQHFDGISYAARRLCVSTFFVA